jgi:hypothetical protein
LHTLLSYKPLITLTFLRFLTQSSYSSVIYDLDGDAWVYTVTAPLTFVREAIVVEQITKDFAYISEGPPAGTQVVTVGVPELYGTEVGVNGE